MSTITKIIEEHQRGLLYRDGRLIKWLEPGRHRYWAWGAEWRIELIDIAQGFSLSTPELRAILPDEAGYEVVLEEHEIAILSVDNKPVRLLETGRYILWQLRHDVRATVYDTRELMADVPVQHEELIPANILTAYTVSENQLIVLSVNGTVTKLLEPGRHQIWMKARRPISIQYLSVDTGYVSVDVMPEIARVLPQKAANPLEVSAGEFAILYREGRAFTCLGPGSYLVWQLRRKITFKVFATDALMTTASEEDWWVIPSTYIIQQTVRPHERCLVWVGGEFVAELGEGRYGINQWRKDVTAQIVDMRERELQIQGQEVMTRDKVTLRLNLVVKWAVRKARASVEAQTALDNAVYSEAQLVARSYIAGCSLDELLEARNAAAEAMLSDLAPRTREWGVEILRIDLKDLILPGEMKTLLNRVIEAEKQAAANVIMRREETAATRAQANTAKMMENNPALMRLKELELLSEVAHNVGNITIVAGGDDIVRAFSGRQLASE